ncbi:hypothetical protein ACF07F_35210 [Streptomyces sp. NPDC015237]|uniref:hypothetical protein n=1 Tax=unclassified Streptomyces TaxID=2593676 RepID=UPI0036FCED88
MPVHAAAGRRAAVYRLYDTDGVLLYIGSVYDPEERCNAHRTKPWWPHVARCTEEWFERRGIACREELKVVAVEGAMYNAMGAPGYRTPDTDAVRRRKELAPLQQKPVGESWDVSEAARKAAADRGVPWGAAVKAGEVAAIEFLEDTGLFAGAVKERRKRIGTDYRTRDTALS